MVVDGRRAVLIVAMRSSALSTLYILDHAMWLASRVLHVWNNFSPSLHMRKMCYGQSQQASTDYLLPFLPPSSVLAADGEATSDASERSLASLILG